MEPYNSGRKVILVKGDKSKQYEQAIFILKAGVKETGIDFVKEAERIINGQTLANKLSEKYDSPYYEPPPILDTGVSSKTQPRQKRRSSLDIALSFALIVTGIAVLALVYFNFI